MKLPILATQRLTAPACISCSGFKKSPLASCHSQELALLSGSRQCQAYSKGQVIYREGSPCLGLYCVQQGKIKVSKVSADGKEQIVRLGTGGDLLGVCSLLGEPNYMASAVALDECVVCFLPRQDVMGMVTGNGQFASALMVLLSKAVHQGDERLLHLAAKPVRERLADALVLLLRTFRKEGEEQFSISISRDDLASLVGTVKETVSRLISEFKEEGIIASKGSKITILRERSLLEISTFYD